MDYLPPEDNLQSKRVWQGLSIFLIVMLLIIAMFYAYTLSTLVDPQSIPLAKGSYGVESGLRGQILNVCPESGQPLGACQFDSVTLQDATTRCTTDDRCSAFYFDGTTMEYVDPSVLTTVSIGGTYIRQFPINSS